VGFQGSPHGVGLDAIDTAAENLDCDAECSAVGCAHVSPGEVVGVQGVVEGCFQASHRRRAFCQSQEVLERFPYRALVQSYKD